MPPKRVKKVMTLPINVIFSHLQVRQRLHICFQLRLTPFFQKKNRVRIWIYEDSKLQVEGCIIGFDEYMNMVVDEAVEVENNKRKEVGRILLKGDAITLIQYVLVTTPTVHSLTNLLQGSTAIAR